MGQTTSMAALLLSAGTKGKRYALPHSRIMIHQPLGGTQGQATDIDIHAREILKIRDTPDFIKYLEKKSADLLGKDIVIRGKAKFSEFSSAYEIVAFDFQDLNVKEELEKTIKEIET